MNGGMSVDFYIRLWEYLGVLADHERSSMSRRFAIQLTLLLW